MCNNIDELPNGAEVKLLCKNIENPDRVFRQQSLEKLLEYCAGPSVINDDAHLVFDRSYVQLFKGYCDKYEKCRGLSITIISTLMDGVPKNSFYPEIIIDTIAKRIGRSEILEESEEIRLLLIKQLGTMMDKFASLKKKRDHLKPSYNCIIDILVKSLEDPYALIQRECCALVVKLTKSTASFHIRCEYLADPLIALLRHRQSPNRIAAIEALGRKGCVYIV